MSLLQLLTPESLEYVSSWTTNYTNAFEVLTPGVNPYTVEAQIVDADMTVIDTVLLNSTVNLDDYVAEILDNAEKNGNPDPEVLSNVADHELLDTATEESGSETQKRSESCGSSCKTNSDCSGDCRYCLASFHFRIGPGYSRRCYSSKSKWDAV